MKIHNDAFFRMCLLTLAIISGTSKSFADDQMLNCDNSLIEAFNDFHASVSSGVELGHAFDAISTAWLTKFFFKTHSQ